MADLQLLLCVFSYILDTLHGGCDTMERVFHPIFFWNTTTADVPIFIRLFLQCLSTAGNTHLPRPFGPALYRARRMYHVHFDYLEQGQRHDGHRYIRLLQDEHSKYCCLFLFGATSAENAVHTIPQWYVELSILLRLMSGLATHF